MPSLPPTNMQIRRARAIQQRNDGTTAPSIGAIMYERQRGTSHRRGYGAAWRRLRDAVLARDHYICQQCGSPTGRSGHADHITPKSEGGQDDPDNLQTLCHACHNAKTRREEARRRTG